MFGFFVGIISGCMIFHIVSNEIARSYPMLADNTGLWACFFGIIGGYMCSSIVNKMRF